MDSRTANQIYEIGMEALVAALGRADAEVFLHQIANGAGPANPTLLESDTPPGDEGATRVTNSPAPPLSEDEQHERIRDMQNPQGQEGLL